MKNDRYYDYRRIETIYFPAIGSSVSIILESESSPSLIAQYGVN